MCLIEPHTCKYNHIHELKLDYCNPVRKELEASNPSGTTTFQVKKFKWTPIWECEGLELAQKTKVLGHCPDHESDRPTQTRSDTRQHVTDIGMLDEARFLTSLTAARAEQRRRSGLQSPDEQPPDLVLEEEVRNGADTSLPGSESSRNSLLQGFFESDESSGNTTASYGDGDTEDLYIDAGGPEF